MHYHLGQYSALVKLGMLSGSAGRVSYSAGRDASGSRDNEKQDLWAEFDQKPGKTYEEKFGSDDYAASSGDLPSEGSRNLSRHYPTHEHRLSSAMQASFDALDDYDPSFGPEPGRTHPHGSSKLAMPGTSSIAAAKPLAPPSLPKINSGAPKPPKIVGNAQHRLHTNVHDIDTSMSTGSVGRRMSGSAL